MARDSPLTWLIPASVALITAAAAYMLGKASTDGRTAGKKDKKAFLLVITHEYKSLRDRDVFISFFEPLAKWVRLHEPETLAYELSVSDKDPHKIIIFERYPDKKTLTDVHQKSAPFMKFKAAVEAANLEYTSKSGESYIESDLGFM